MLFLAGCAQALGAAGARFGAWSWLEWPAPVLWIMTAVAMFVVPQRAVSQHVNQSVRAVLWTAAAGAALLWLQPGVLDRAQSLHAGLSSETDEDDVESIALRSLNVDTRDFTRTFGRRRDIRLVLRGRLWAPENGAYRLNALSDDRLTLSLNGKRVVDAGTGPAVTTLLTRGWHAVEIEYRHRRGPGFLRVSWDRPAFWEWLPLDRLFAAENEPALAAPVESSEARAGLFLILKALFWLLLVALLLRAAEARPLAIARLRQLVLPWTDMTSGRARWLIGASGVVIVVLLASFVIEMGASDGLFDYPRHAFPSLRMLAVVALAAAIVIPLFIASDRIFARRPRLTLALWFLAAFGIQLLLRTLYPLTLSEIVQNDATTSFYSAAKRHGVVELLSDHARIAPTLAQHANANMPGKILFYRVMMNMLGESPLLLGYAIILIANLCAYAVHALTLRLYRNSTAAFYGFILALFVPARIFFFPILNTVSPLPILAALVLFARYWDSRRLIDLAGVGAALYVTVLFDPAVLPLGILFIAILAAKRPGAGWRECLKAVFIPLAAFACVNAVVDWAVHYEIIRSFRLVLDEAQRFNVTSRRPYDVWVFANLKEFVINSGLASSLILILALLRTTLAPARETGAHRMSAIARIMLLSFTLTVAVVDLMGINRGETTRLWIYLALVLQMVAAERAALGGRRLMAIVLAITLAQTGVALQTIAFVRYRAVAGF